MQQCSGCARYRSHLPGHQAPPPPCLTAYRLSFSGGRHASASRAPASRLKACRRLTLPGPEKRTTLPGKGDQGALRRVWTGCNALPAGPSAERKGSNSPAGSPSCMRAPPCTNARIVLSPTGAILASIGSIWSAAARLPPGHAPFCGDSLAAASPASSDHKKTKEEDSSFLWPPRAFGKGLAYARSRLNVARAPGG